MRLTGVIKTRLLGFVCSAYRFGEAPIGLLANTCSPSETGWLPRSNPAAKPFAKSPIGASPGHSTMLQ